MAEKRSKSILSGLKTMLHREPEKPSQPAKKPTAAERKKPAPATGAKEQRPAAPAEPPAPSAEAASQPAPEKKKVQNQPWYRHRKRW